MSTSAKHQVKMTEIKGLFEVSLTKPIAVSFDFPDPGLAVCQFKMEGDTVSIWPLQITEGVCYEEDFDPPKINEIKVGIVKESTLDIRRSLILPRTEEQEFERKLIEAVSHLVTTIRHKTNQWDLDTRHPIHTYSYEYWVGDTKIVTTHPLEAGAKRYPEYIAATIAFATDDFYSELSREMWQEVITEIRGPRSIFPYDELLADARTLRTNMGYDTSVLYAAIASELMLEKACQNILITRHAFNEKQCIAFVAKMRIRGILELIKNLEPTLPLNYKAVNKLFELRNKLAHGQSQNITGDKAAEAISTAKYLRDVLSGLLDVV